MKRLLSVILFSGVVFGNAFASFLPGTEDIPLMDGVTLWHADDFVFDSPVGQVLTLSGVTQSSAKEVRLFYDRTLAELGWIKSGTDIYQRNRDVLHLTIQSRAEGTHVLFDITLSDDAPVKKTSASQTHSF